jgi:membrane protein YqaA with SNARE-associated domain
MSTTAFSWRAFYLRWAGLLSAGMGFLASFLLVLAFREDDPGPKLALAIAGVIGAFVGYAIGKDILDRIRNHEASADEIPTLQARLAKVGSRFILALFLLFGLSVLIWSISLLIEPFRPFLF